MPTSLVRISYVMYVTHQAQCLTRIGNGLSTSTSLPCAFKILILSPHEGR